MSRVRAAGRVRVVMLIRSGHLLHRFQSHKQKVFPHGKGCEEKRRVKDDSKVWGLNLHKNAVAILLRQGRLRCGLTVEFGEKNQEFSLEGV